MSTPAAPAAPTLAEPSGCCVLSAIYPLTTNYNSTTPTGGPFQSFNGIVAGQYAYKDYSYYDSFAAYARGMPYINVVVGATVLGWIRADYSAVVSLNDYYYLRMGLHGFSEAWVYIYDTYLEVRSITDTVLGSYNYGPINHTWHHWAMVLQGGVATIYMDGSVVLVVSKLMASQTPSALSIGGGPVPQQGSETLQIKARGVEFYTKALTQAEIIARMNAYP